MAVFEQMQEYFSSLSDRIYFDKIISLGSTCKTAYQLKRLGLRTGSYPLDWLFCEDVHALIDAIENDFEDWCLLSNLEEGESTTDHRMVIDKKYNTIYQHHFPKNFTLEESYDRVYETIHRRVERLLQLKRSSQTILFVRAGRGYADRGYTDAESALRLGKLLSGYGSGGFLLVINCTKSFSINTVKIIAPNVIMTEIYDENEGQGEAWRGFNPYWNKLFEKIGLNEFSADLDDDSLFEGFYQYERDISGQFRWLSKEGQLFLTRFGGRRCRLRFASDFDNIYIYNGRNEKMSSLLIPQGGSNEFDFRIEHETRKIRLVADRVWKPCDYSEVSDDRQLSVRLNQIYLYN